MFVVVPVYRTGLVLPFEPQPKPIHSLDVNISKPRSHWGKNIWRGSATKLAVVVVEALVLSIATVVSVSVLLLLLNRILLLLLLRPTAGTERRVSRTKSVKAERAYSLLVL